MPFPGGIEAFSNGALILSIVAAAIYAYAVVNPPGIRRSVIKTAAVALLATIAFAEGGPWLLVGALAFGAVGDAFLSREGEAAFLGGLASFLVAHALYIALFQTVEVEPLLPDTARAAITIVLALATLALATLLWINAPGRLRVPILVYAAAIFVMALSALTLNSAVVILGALLFMLSDALLGTERFLLGAASPHRVWVSHAVWLTYYAAQLLITLGFLLGGL